MALTKKDLQNIPKNKTGFKIHYGFNFDPEKSFWWDNIYTTCLNANYILDDNLSIGNEDEVLTSGGAQGIKWASPKIKINSNINNNALPLIMSPFNASELTSTKTTESVNFTPQLLFSNSGKGHLIIGSAPDGEPAYVSNDGNPSINLNRKDGYRFHISVTEAGTAYFSSSHFQLEMFQSSEGVNYFTPNENNEVWLGRKTEKGTTSPWAGLIAKRAIINNNTTGNDNNALEITHSGATNHGIHLIGTMASTTWDPIYCAANKGGISLRLGTNNVGLWNFECSDYSNSSGIGNWIVSAPKTGGPAVLNTKSDKRLKNEKGLSNINNTLTVLREVPIIDYTYKDDRNNILRKGIYAQDLITILKTNNIENFGLVLSQKNDELFYNINLPENEVTYSVDYMSFVPFLWDGWKYHDNEIQKLKNEIERLKNELKEVKR